jgi:hypothetical protein
MYMFKLSGLVLLLSITGAQADETPPNKWASSPYHAWMGKQRINEAARRLDRNPYLPWSNCCDNADRVKTQFRVNRDTNKDTWWWLDGNTWRQVPDDIIHEEYDPTMPEDLRREGVLFVYRGKPTCFWYPEGGI